MERRVASSVWCAVEHSLARGYECAAVILRQNTRALLVETELTTLILDRRLRSCVTSATVFLRLAIQHLMLSPGPYLSYWH